ncbi:MAG: hypothetical protein EOM59_20120, partial [Clostridia bacterium]|nr:hypothetical protein [Clostridia bacterium]
MGYYKKLSTQAQNVRKLTSQLHASRRSSNLPFELSLESSSEVDKFQRAQDKVAMKQFNKDVEDWSEKSKQALRISIKSLVKR